MKHTSKLVIPESVVLGSCINLLAGLRIYAWRNNTGALKNTNGRLIKYGLKGSADIIGICPDGRFLAIECKRTGGKTRPEQDAFLESIKKNKGVACVVHDAEELLKELKEQGVITQ